MIYVWITLWLYADSEEEPEKRELSLQLRGVNIKDCFLIHPLGHGGWNTELKRVNPNSIDTAIQRQRPPPIYNFPRVCGWKFWLDVCALKFADFFLVFDYNFIFSFHFSIHDNIPLNCLVSFIDFYFILTHTQSARNHRNIGYWELPCSFDSKRPWSPKALLKLFLFFWKRRSAFLTTCCED